MKRITIDDFRKFETVLCDLDGVVWMEEEVIWENVEGLKRLKEMGKKLVFLTNNSTRTPEYYAERLRALGLYPDKVITPSVVAAEYLFKRGIKRVFAIGEDGLIDPLKSKGITTDDVNPEAVVVGLDRNFNYEKLKKAANFVHRGLTFIATNTDAHIKKSDGILPGAGSLVSAISYASGREPDAVMGKPNRYIYEFSGSIETAIVIGDRLDTDIIGGNRLNIPTVFVLTGVHTLEDVERLKIVPTYFAENLSNI
ncbi:MAG: HAD-IIA family hydrolase [candidate division WOR-3 bacterium]